LFGITAGGLLLRAQEAGQRPVFRVKVDMVVLAFTVTDNRNHYVNDLKPSDLRIYEDGILQKLNTFAEGGKPPVGVLDGGKTQPLVDGKLVTEGGPGLDRPDAFVGTNVFILFDTSNFMYRGFVYAEDAIADFVRGLDRADSVAVYTFSRNLSRAATLSRERNDAILGLRKSVAGDDTALYNALLLTLRDAAKVPGRKVVIVFSNGPDNASMVNPDDVRSVAEDEGIPIYVISTAEASSNLARYDGVRYTNRVPADTLSDMYRNTRGEGFGAECKRRIMLGTYVLSHGYYDAYYVKAQKVRTLITRDFANAFTEVDAIVAPVSPFPAFKLGEKVDDPVAMYLSDIYTITGSLAGIPCMSVPCGKTAAGLPVGLQILTRHFDEATMFRLAHAYETTVTKSGPLQ